MNPQFNDMALFLRKGFRFEEKERKKGTRIEGNRWSFKCFTFCPSAISHTHTPANAAFPTIFHRWRSMNRKMTFSTHFFVCIRERLSLSWVSVNRKLLTLFAGSSPPHPHRSSLLAPMLHARNVTTILPCANRLSVCYELKARGFVFQFIHS